MSKEIISCKDLTFSYESKKPLLDGITFSLQKGDFALLLGDNGSGKTTLVKLLLKKLKPVSGHIRINGEDINKKKSWRDVGYVPQKMYITSHHPVTVGELITDSHICEHLKIDSLLAKQFHKLSGGQQQKVLVALALQTNPPLLILDEPTVGIDEKSRKEFYSMLAHLVKHHQITILLVTHDSDVASQYVTKKLCIDKNKHFHSARCIHD